MWVGRGKRKGNSAVGGCFNSMFSLDECVIDILKQVERSKRTILHNMQAFEGLLALSELAVKTDGWKKIPFPHYKHARRKMIHIYIYLSISFCLS